MQKLPEKCPICKSEILVTRFFCPHCDSIIEGHFQPQSGPFSDLTEEQIHFVLTFVRCEGRFNRMEEELNLSYPTLRNRLYDVIRALGYEPGKDEEPTLSAEDRRRILDDLEQGKISPLQAQQLLQGLEVESMKGE
ncbi:MAG: DUF2089 domain-containing protein [Chloroflexota bacterium]|nr:DUF2089 domain-containing protein [Chloroflexota bacterium]